MQVKFVCFSDSKSKVFKSCGFHLIRRREGDIFNRWYSITKRSRADDDDDGDGDGVMRSKRLKPNTFAFQFNNSRLQGHYDCERHPDFKTYHNCQQETWSIKFPDSQAAEPARQPPLE